VLALRKEKIVIAEKLDAAREKFVFKIEEAMQELQENSVALHLCTSSKKEKGEGYPKPRRSFHHSTHGLVEVPVTESTFMSCSDSDEGGGNETSK